MKISPSLLAADFADLAAHVARVEAAGADYQGGSLYALIVNTEAADLTEKRVLELYELLK